MVDKDKAFLYACNSLSQRLNFYRGSGSYSCCTSARGGVGTAVSSDRTKIRSHQIPFGRRRHNISDNGGLLNSPLLMT